MSDRFDELRELIAENDRTIVAAVNERLRLVAELWEIKQRRGDPTVDPDRERALRASLAATSLGPLSPGGVDRLVTALLDLTKAELAAGEDGRA